MIRMTPTQPTKTQKMQRAMQDLAWLSKVATEKTTPFEQCNLDLLHDTLWKALRAVEDCRETK